MNLRSFPPAIDAPFLATKVQPPVRPSSLVSRAGLVQRLDDGANAELTMVSGPAGSGKTSLLSDWGARSGQDRTCWLRLDPFDNDPSQFWIGVLGSVSTVAGPTFIEHLPRLGGLVRSDVRAFLHALGSSLEDSGRRVTLVLDDLHEITNDQIYSALSLTIENLSVFIRLVVSTRTTPPLGLARLRARGRLCEVRFEDLRFSVAESAQLLTQVAHRSVDADLVDRVHHDTDGWAAALYVAAIGLDGNEGVGDSGFSGDQSRHLSEYLVEEVLSRESEDRQRFLLETSILDRLSPARCEALTGCRDAAEILRQLERSNQFVRRIGSDGRWFSYHGLLRDLLRDELKLRGEDHWRELHKRASQVALVESDPAAAIRHSLEAGNLSTTAGLIAASWIEFTNRGLFATVIGWLDAWNAAEGDQPTVPADPTIFVVGGWMALHTGRLDEVEPWLRRAAAHDYAGSLSDGTRSTRSAVAIVRSSHRRRIGDVGGALTASKIAMEEESQPESPWRAVACVGHGSALFWTDDSREAGAALDEARTVAEATSLMVPVLVSDGYRALISRDAGESDSARAMSLQAVDLAESAHLSAYDQAAPAYLAAGLCHLDGVDLDQAEPFLTKALGLARQGGERLLEAEAHLALMQLAQLRSDAVRAEREWAAANELIIDCPDPGPRLLRHLIADRTTGPKVKSGSGAHSSPVLTDREFTVLRYLRSSLTLPEIADELFVSANTVKSHVASIRTKLGVNSRQEAVRKAQEDGMLS